MEYISINGHKIRQNAKNGMDEPVIRIAKKKNDKSPRYAKQIKINGPSKLIYSPHKKILSCGARLVIETKDGNVEIIE